MRVFGITCHLKRDVPWFSENNILAPAEIPSAGILVHGYPFQERNSLVVLAQQGFKLLNKIDYNDREVSHYRAPYEFALVFAYEYCHHLNIFSHGADVHSLQAFKVGRVTLVRHR